MFRMSCPSGEFEQK